MEESFQFNFFQQQPTAAAVRPQQQQQQQQQQPCTVPEPLAAAEVPHTEGVQASADPSRVELDNGIVLLKGLVSSEDAAAMLSDPQLEASDLVPNMYEGGFKLWEGAVDLCNYLIQQQHLSADSLAGRNTDNGLKGKRVLELGCGHGLPGILCLLAGAAVHFQDYNKQVVTHLTLPNVQANLAQLPAGATRPTSRYYSGDWAAVGQLLASQGMGGYYDIILTAETIYNEDSQQRLLDCIKQVLQPPHGVVYVAAKSFYFGVGGSTSSFAELVKADGVLECMQVWKVEDGSSNKREILKLHFPEAITPYFL